MTSDIVLVDTSVAIALVVADHEHHTATADALGRRRLGLAGHACFETYSVLTRLPAPLRRTPAVVAQLMGRNFPETRYLGAEATSDIVSRLADLGIAGGAVYDALVGAVSLEHNLTLVTRDRRAVDTYRAMGVETEVLR